MKISPTFALAAVLMMAQPADAQAVRSEVTAPNGVKVTVYTDEFAERYEYTAPMVQVGDGFVLVGRTDRGGTDGNVRLIGSFVYSGDWRFYDGALFRGGAQAEFVSQGRDVGRCSGSRYSRGCTLTESFAILINSEQLSQHARNGTLDVQVRSGRTGESVVFSVPVSYFEAVQQVAEARP